MVEQRHDRNRVVAGDSSQSGQRRVTRQLIVESRRTEKLFIEAGDCAWGGVVQHQLPGQDVVAADVDRRRDRVEDVVAFTQPVHGGEVQLSIERQPLIGDITVEMDRELRNTQYRRIDQHEAFASLGSTFANSDSS